MDSTDRTPHPRWQTHPPKSHHKTAALLLAAGSILLVLGFLYILRAPFLQPELQLFSIGPVSPRSSVQDNWIEIDCADSIESWTKQIENRIHHQQPVFVFWQGSLTVDPEEPGLRKLDDKSHSRSTGRSIRDAISHLKRIACREIILIVDAVSPSRNRLDQIASIACEDIIRDLIEEELSEANDTPMAVLVSLWQAQETSESCEKSAFLCEFNNQLADRNHSSPLSTTDLLSLVDTASQHSNRRSLPWVFSPHWPLDPRLIQLRSDLSQFETGDDSLPSIALATVPDVRNDREASNKIQSPTISSSKQIQSYCAVIERELMAKGQLLGNQHRTEVQSTLVDLENQLRHHLSLADWKLWQSKQSEVWRSTWEGEWITQLLEHSTEDEELIPILIANRLKSAQLAIHHDTNLWVEDWYQQAEQLRCTSERCCHDRVSPQWQQTAKAKARSASKLYGQCQSILEKVAVERDRFERFIHQQVASTEPNGGMNCEEIHDVARWKAWIQLLHDNNDSAASSAIELQKCVARRERLESILHADTGELSSKHAKVYPVGYRAPSSLMHRNDVVVNQLMRFGFSRYASHIASQPDLANSVFEAFERTADRLADETVSSKVAVREILDLEKWIEAQWQRGHEFNAKSHGENSSPWTTSSPLAPTKESLSRSLHERYRQAVKGANQRERDELSRVDHWISSLLEVPPVAVPTIAINVPTQLDWLSQNPIQFAVSVKGVKAGMPLVCTVELEDPQQHVSLDGLKVNHGESVTLPTRAENRNISCEVRIHQTKSRNYGPFRMVLHTSQGDLHSRECIDLGATHVRMASVSLSSRSTSPINSKPVGIVPASNSNSAWAADTKANSGVPYPRDVVWQCMPNRVQPTTMYIRNRLLHTETYSLRLHSLAIAPDFVLVGVKDSKIVDQWLTNASSQLLATAMVVSLPSESERPISWKPAESNSKNPQSHICSLIIEVTSSDGTQKELIPCHLSRVTPRSRIEPSVAVDLDKGLIAVKIQRVEDAPGAWLPCRIDGILRDQVNGAPVSSGRVEIPAHESIATLNLSIANCRSDHPILELLVDGQPCSFVYKFPSNRSGPIEESTTCVGVTVDVKPSKRIPLWNETKIDAICSSFISDGMWDSLRDRFSVGIDRNGDRIMDRDHVHAIPNPVAMHIDWRGVNAEGNPLIETTIDIPHVSIPVDTRWNQFASLVATFERPGDSPLYSNECAIVLDREPPSVVHAWPSNLAARSLLGPPMAVEVEVFDSLSPVVWVGGGWSNHGQMDFVDGTEILPAIRLANGQWSLALPTEKQLSGNNVLLIQSKDAAGNTSAVHRMLIELRTAKELEAIDASRTTMVSARALFGKQSLENIRVSLYPVAPTPEASASANGPASSPTKPAYEAKTNQAGECRFENVRNGKYRMEASGSIKGNRQLRSMTVDVDASKPWEAYTFRFDLKGQ